MSDKDVAISIGVDDSALVTGLKTAEAAVKGSADVMSGALNPVTSAFAKLQGVFAAFTAVLAGGAVFKAGVAESQKLTGEANRLARSLGISTTEASHLNTALGDIYASAEDFTGASSKLAKQVRTNEDALNAMGLKTRDANGQYRNMKDLMLDAITVLNGYKEGTDRTLAAQAMFGKGADEVMGLLKLNNEVVDEAKKKNEALGLVIGSENVAASKAYKAAMNDVGDVMDAMKKAIGDALIPVLTKLGEWFSDIGPMAVTVIKGAIGGLTALFWGLKVSVEILWNVWMAGFEAMANRATTFADVVNHALHLDFEGAKAAWNKGSAELGDILDKRMENVANSAQEAREKIWNLFAAPTDSGPKKPTGKNYVAPPDKPTEVTSKDKSRMPAWEAELSAQKSAYMEAHDMYEMSLADEKAYWDKLLATLSKGDKEYGAVMKKSADLRLQILKKSAADGRAIRQEEIDAWKAQALDGVTAEQQAAQQQLDMRQITQAEMLQLEQKFEQERFEINLQALQQRMELLKKDPNMSPVEYQKLKDEILAIERKHQLDKQALANKVQLQAAGPGLKVWDSMESGFANAIHGMITKAQTLRQALSGIFQSIFGTFVQEMIAKPLAQWAMRILRETALYKLLTGAQIAASSESAAVQAATQKALGITGVMSNAAIAATAAMASVAAIPVVGWAMAPEVGAGTYATAMGFLPSARNGFDIPAGLNPVTQLHEREMVLPAAQADAVRNMANGNGGGGAVNINITAMDSKDVHRVLMSNIPAVSAAGRRAARRFSPTSISQGLGKVY